MCDSKDILSPLGQWLWIPAIVLFSISATIMLGVGYQLHWTDWVTKLAPILAFGALAGYLSNRISQRIGTGATAFFQGSMFSLSSMLLTLAAATSSRPLADGMLLSADQFIGYDWKAYATFIFSHQILSSYLIPSYSLIFVQPLIVVVSLSYVKKFEALEQFILVTFVSQIIAISIFYFFPATQAWTYLGISDEQIAAFPTLSHSHGTWVSDLLLIRSGGLRNLPGLYSAGLIAFPSFHCIAGLTFVWAVRSVKAVLPTFVIMNCMMIAATPIVGGHYAIDLVCGAVVFAISVALTSWLYPKACAHVARVRARSGPRVVAQERFFASVAL